VYWDEPDASRHNLTHFYYKRRPANEKERQICEQNDVKGVLQSSRSQATITRIGTAGPNVLRGGPESNILSGRAGNDVLVSGGGSNRLSGGGGNDMLLGNSTDGKNVLNGGPGGDTIVDRGPALVRTGTRTGRGWDYVYVRDGHSDDTVICGSRRSIVYADKGDRVRGHCGRVIRRGPINRPRPLM
jgi:Ca2+-binding RTX toxin-like protein